VRCNRLQYLKAVVPIFLFGTQNDRGVIESKDFVTFIAKYIVYVPVTFYMISILLLAGIARCILRRASVNREKGKGAARIYACDAP